MEALLEPESTDGGTGGGPDVTATGRSDITTGSRVGSALYLGSPLHLCGMPYHCRTPFLGSPLHFSGTPHLSSSPPRLDEQIVRKTVRIHP